MGIARGRAETEVADVAAAESDSLAFAELLLVDDHGAQANVQVRGVKTPVTAVLELSYRAEHALWAPLGEAPGRREWAGVLAPRSSR